MTCRTNPLLALAFAATIALMGCDSQPADTENQAATGGGEAGAGDADPADTNADEPEDADSDADSDADAVNADLASLSPEERAAVEEQQICPVSGEELGSMGTPLKVDVDGRVVWICCEGCRDALQENPEEYLAKLATSEE